MNNFKVNQKVICDENNFFTYRKIWFFTFKRKDSNYPVYGKIYTVSDSAFHEKFKEPVIKIKGYNDWFISRCFKPVDEDFLNETLEKINEEAIKHKKKEKLEKFNLLELGISFLTTFVITTLILTTKEKEKS